MSDCVRITKSDLCGAARLEALCFSEPWSENALQMLLSENAVGFAVKDGQDVLAYGGMMTVLDEGQITNSAVSPEHRRRGFGEAVTRALLDYAKERGIVSVSLEVRESNAAAIALYEKLGFERRGIRKGFYRAPIEAAIVMVWDNERN